jgi:flagellar basal-body rod protein FlgG
MSSGLYTAVCGDIMQERRLEILSNNLANVSTSGYKEDKPHFGATYPALDTAVPTDHADARSLVLSRKMSMSYPTLSGITTDFSVGEMQQTGNELNVAISGSGFFAVNTPGGELYTRTGNFSLNSKKELVTQSGHPVRGKEKNILIEGKTIDIARDGTITVDGQLVDTLKVVDFEDYSGLVKVGDNLFKNVKGTANERQAEVSEVQQRHLELSNIDIVQEMVKMIDVTRICESYQKVIRALDEIDAQATKEIAAVA